VQTVPATGRLEEHVLAPQFKAKTASRLWIIWLRFIFLLCPFFFFFFFSSQFFSTATDDATAMWFPLSLSSLAGTLSSSFLFCLSDARYERSYRHFTVKPSVIFPSAESER
jgi:hypothetical protein